MPPHLVYVEPFFGAGHVLFSRDTQRDCLFSRTTQTEKVPAHLSGSSEVVNDVHFGLINFCRVLPPVLPYAVNSVLYGSSAAPFLIRQLPLW